MCWVNFNVLEDSVGLIWKHDYNWVLFTQSDLIRWIVWDTTGSPSRAEFSQALIAPGEWHHITGVYGADHRAQLFLDGVATGTVGDAGVDIRDQAGDLFIGVRGDFIAPAYLDGYLALPCIYNRGVSQADIWHNIYNPLNPIRDGLVLFLPMVEGSGISVADYSGLGNNGTISGGVSWEELMLWEIPAAAGL